MTSMAHEASPTSLNIAVIGGDGIGPEVVAEGIKILQSVTGDITVSTTDYDLGARRWHATGETLPDSVVEELKGHDAILLGAIGDPSVPSGVLERGVLLPLRFALDHYVNLRPRRACRAGRLRACAGPPPQASDFGAQAQRPHPRRPPVAAHRRGGGR